MYIEIHNYRKMEQEVLYFKLTNAFNMDKIEKLNEKIAGIYTIYKDDRCVYVGQSINLASRLATHLRGKYATATSVFCWEANNLYWDEFEHASKDEKKVMLDNAEKYVMAKFKPVENLMIDMDFKLPECDVPDVDTCFGGNIRLQMTNAGFLIVSNSESRVFGNIESSIFEAHYNNEIDDKSLIKMKKILSKYNVIDIDDDNKEEIQLPLMEAI